jgi:hypothetical protein
MPSIRIKQGAREERGRKREGEAHRLARPSLHPCVFEWKIVGPQLYVIFSTTSSEERVRERERYIERDTTRDRELADTDLTSQL